MARLIKDGFQNGNRLTNLILVVFMPIVVLLLGIVINKLDTINTDSIKHTEQIETLQKSDDRIQSEFKNELNKMEQRLNKFKL